MISELIPKVAGFEREDNHKYYPRPSMSGPERCIRQMVYWSREIPRDKEMSDRFILVLDDSSWHEYLSIDWLNKSAFHIHSQQMKVETDGLKGSIDGVITDMTGKDRLFEHKAINHFTFERYWGGAFPLDYFTQCCIYIRGLQKINPEINECILLVKNKNTSQFLDFVLRYDSAKDELFLLEIEHSKGEKLDMNNDPIRIVGNPVTDALAKFALIAKHTEAQTLPDRPFDRDDWHCAYCAWGETCWEGYEKEVEAFSGNVEFEEELIRKFAAYFQLSRQWSKLDKKKKELNDELKHLMKEREAKQGRAGRYLASFALQPYDYLNKDKIAGPILQIATEKRFKEILRVTDTEAPKKSTEWKLQAMKAFYGIKEDV